MNSPFPQPSKWVQYLKQKTSVSDAMVFFVKTSSHPLIYFEYTHQSLIIRYKSPCLPDIKPPYIHLYKTDPSFHAEQLYSAHQIPTFHSYVQKHLGDYHHHSLVFNNQIQGVFVYLQEVPESFLNQLFFFDNYIKYLLWEERNNKETLYDEQTGFLNQKTFLKKLFIEIFRARRLNLPLSLLLMKVDQIEHIQSVHGNHVVDALMKALSKHLVKDTRVYDITGAWPLGYMGLILPHTSERSAGIKAENIRWILKSSNFSKALPDRQHLSMSLGLAEYPKVGRSANSLFESALKALAFAKKEGKGDMTAVVTPAKNFKPDFSVPSYTLSTLRDFI